MRQQLDHLLEASAQSLGHSFRGFIVGVDVADESFGAIQGYYESLTVRLAWVTLGVTPLTHRRGRPVRDDEYVDHPLIAGAAPLTIDPAPKFEAQITDPYRVATQTVDAALSEIP